MNEISTENIFETIQDVDKTILKITECIQGIRDAENKLNLKDNKTSDEILTLKDLKNTFDQKLKELNEQFNLSNQLKMRMMDKTMNKNYDGAGQPNSGCQDLMPISPQNICFNDSNSVCQSNCSIRDHDNNTNINTLTAQCSDNFYNLQEVCQLKEQLQNIVNENQELIFSYKSITERNDLLVKALNRPDVFKKTEGCIRFPGKKEMEEKLSEFKTEILRLNSKIKEVHITHLKLKSAKKILDQFNVSNCQCGNPSFNNNIITSTKVQKQEIEQIELQIKQKNKELNNVVSDYENTIKMNNQITEAHHKLSDGLEQLLKKIEECHLEGKQDLLNDLNKNNEEIETMELIIKERNMEINDCDEKLKQVQHETEDIILKTQKLEVALKNLSKDFNESYNKLEYVYKEQLEEMFALPKVLKETHIKLQEETDLRVLAEETMNKLERDIKKVESLKNPIQNNDETIIQSIEDEKLKIETGNHNIELKLKSLEENIQSATECLDKETQELEEVNLQIQDAIADSNKHINAYKQFSEIYMEKIVHDLHKLQETLTDTQSRACEKFLVKKSFIDHIKDKITSINQNVEECQEEMCILLPICQK